MKIDIQHNKKIEVGVLENRNIGVKTVETAIKSDIRRKKKIEVNVLEAQNIGVKTVETTINVVNPDGTDSYTGTYSVVPTTTGTVLETKGKLMLRDVAVFAIPYYETSNESGTTVVIGE